MYATLSRTWCHSLARIVRVPSVSYRQAMGMEHRVDDPGDPDKLRYQVKPVENRSLYVPTR